MVAGLRDIDLVYTRDQQQASAIAALIAERADLNRGHIERIYAKLGVNRQADLIARLHCLG